MVQSELQKRADRADQSVLFFLAGANFWEKQAKNCAIMSMAHIFFINIYYDDKQQYEMQYEH